MPGWPPLPAVRPELPTRRKTFLDIEVLGGISVGGDIISANWDGSAPLNLSTVNAITAGYALDSSAGTMQISSNMFIGTDTSYIQIKGVGGGNDAIVFHDMQGALQTAPSTDAFIVHDNSDSGSSIDAGTLWMQSFEWSSQDTAAILLTAFSNTTTKPAYISLQIGGNEVGQINKIAHQPGADSTYSLGTTGLRWATGYMDAIVGLDWTTWTPTYTNLTIGNGTVVARYVQIGDTVIAYYDLTFGSTTTIDGTDPTISKPVAALAGYGSTVPFGSARLLDSGSADHVGSVREIIGTNFNVQVDKVDGTYTVATAISATVPFTWTTNDKLVFIATYEVA